mmetsp:Transcript_2185/g.5188  ORF Transcript_2185/g.5188 Transcript_2185/m.5188 type:complete len:100 (+) Transcript_2185:16-315(+)
MAFVFCLGVYLLASQGTSTEKKQFVQLSREQKPRLEPWAQNEASTKLSRTNLPLRKNLTTVEAIVSPIWEPVKVALISQGWLLPTYRKRKESAQGSGPG